MEEINLLGRKPVNIFTFTATAMRMSVYWSVLNPVLLRNNHFLFNFVLNLLRTSVMFVSISFIVLMMISLAWLVFYYIQRFRYLHAKDRLSVSLF